MDINESEANVAKSDTKVEAAKVAAGADVHLVLASGKHTAAKCIKVHKAGKLIDLEAQVGEELVTITGSPLDETGKMPDSWHLPEEAEAE